MIRISSLKKAVRDLRYLLNHEYPRESAVNFVSNHYRMHLEERHLLVRCVFSKAEINAHQRKAVEAAGVKGKRLGVDGYNILITTESILTGKQVILCDDGYIRDLRAIFGKYRSGPDTARAIKAIVKVVVKSAPKETLVLFDKQVGHSGELASDFRERLRLSGLKGDSFAVGGVDMKLREFDVAASSDRAVIEKSKAIWNLPAEIVRTRKANLMDLKNLK